MTKHGEFESGLVPLTLRVPKDLWDEMDQARKQHKIKSMNEFIRLCIRSFLAESATKAEQDQGDLRAQMKRLEALLIWNSLNQQLLVAEGIQKILMELSPEAHAEDLAPVDEQLSQLVASSRQRLPAFSSELRQLLKETEGLFEEA